MRDQSDLFKVMELSRGPRSRSRWLAGGGLWCAGSIMQQGWIQPGPGAAAVMPALANVLTQNQQKNFESLRNRANFYPFASQNGPMLSRLLQKVRKFPAKPPSFPSLLTSAANSGPGHAPARCSCAPDLLPLMPLCPLAVIFLSIGRRSR